MLSGQPIGDGRRINRRTEYGAALIIRPGNPLIGAAFRLRSVPDIQPSLSFHRRAEIGSRSTKCYVFRGTGAR